MKKVINTLMMSFVIMFMFSLITNASANDWEIESGGISTDQVSSVMTLASSGTGTQITPTAKITINVGSGQAFFNANTVITPNIDITASADVVAQVAVVLGKNQELIAYYDPDDLLNPWSVNIEDEFYITNNSKNFDLFSLEGSIVSALISGNDALKPFGIFVRVMQNDGTVLDQASFTSYLLSPNLVLSPVTAPW